MADKNIIEENQKTQNISTKRFSSPVIKVLRSRKVARDSPNLIHEDHSVRSPSPEKLADTKLDAWQQEVCMDGNTKMADEREVVNKSIKLMRAPVRKSLKGKKRSKTLTEIHETQSACTHFQSAAEVRSETNFGIDKMLSRMPSVKRVSSLENTEKVTRNDQPAASKKRSHSEQQAMKPPHPFFKYVPSSEHLAHAAGRMESNQQALQSATKIGATRALNTAPKRISFLESNQKYLTAVLNKHKSDSSIKVSTISPIRFDDDRPRNEMPKTPKKSNTAHISNTNTTSSLLPTPPLRIFDVPKNNMPKKTAKDSFKRIEERPTDRVASCSDPESLPKNCMPPKKSLSGNQFKPLGTHDDILPKNDIPRKMATESSIIDGTPSYREPDRLQKDRKSLSGNQPKPLGTCDDTLPKNDIPRKMATESVIIDRPPSYREPDRLQKDTKSLSGNQPKPLGTCDDTLPKNDIPRKMATESAIIDDTSSYKEPDRLPINCMPKKSSSSETRAQEQLKLNFVESVPKERQPANVTNKDVNSTCPQMHKLRILNDAFPKDDMVKETAIGSTRGIDKPHHSDPESLPKNCIPKKISIITHIARPTFDVVKDRPKYAEYPKNDMPKGQGNRIMKPPVNDLQVPKYKELPINDIPKKSVVKPHVLIRKDAVKIQRKVDANLPSKSAQPRKQDKINRKPELINKTNDELVTKNTKPVRSLTQRATDFTAKVGRSVRARSTDTPAALKLKQEPLPHSSQQSVHNEDQNQKSLELEHEPADAGNTKQVQTTMAAELPKQSQRTLDTPEQLQSNGPPKTVINTQKLTTQAAELPQVEPCVALPVEDVPKQSQPELKKETLKYESPKSFRKLTEQNVMKQPRELKANSTRDGTLETSKLKREALKLKVPMSALERRMTRKKIIESFCKDSKRTPLYKPPVRVKPPPSGQMLLKHESQPSLKTRPVIKGKTNTSASPALKPRGEMEAPKLMKRELSAQQAFNEQLHKNAVFSLRKITKTSPRIYAKLPIHDSSAQLGEEQHFNETKSDVPQRQVQVDGPEPNWNVSKKGSTEAMSLKPSNELPEQLLQEDPVKPINTDTPRQFTGQHKTGTYTQTNKEKCSIDVTKQHASGEKIASEVTTRHASREKLNKDATEKATKQLPLSKTRSNQESVKLLISTENSMGDIFVVEKLEPLEPTVLQSEVVSQPHPDEIEIEQRERAMATALRCEEIMKEISQLHTRQQEVGENTSDQTLQTKGEQQTSQMTVPPKQQVIPQSSSQQEPNDISDYSKYHENLQRFIPDEVAKKPLKQRLTRPPVILPPKRAVNKTQHPPTLPRITVHQPRVTVNAQSASNLQPKLITSQQAKLAKAAMNRKQAEIDKQTKSDKAKQAAYLQSKPDAMRTAAHNPGIGRYQIPAQQQSMHDWSKSDKIDDSNKDPKNEADTVVTVPNVKPKSDSEDPAVKVGSSKAANTDASTAVIENLQGAPKINEKQLNTQLVSDSVPANLSNPSNVRETSVADKLSGEQLRTESTHADEDLKLRVSLDPATVNVMKPTKDGEQTILTALGANASPAVKIKKPILLENDDESEFKFEENAPHPQIKALPEVVWFKEDDSGKITEKTVNVMAGQTHPRLLLLKPSHKEGKPRLDILALRKTARDRLKIKLPEQAKEALAIKPEQKQPQKVADKPTEAKDKTTTATDQALAVADKTTAATIKTTTMLDKALPVAEKTMAATNKTTTTMDKAVPEADKTTAATNKATTTMDKALPGANTTLDKASPVADTMLDKALPGTDKTTAAKDKNTTTLDKALPVADKIMAATNKTMMTIDKALPVAKAEDKTTTTLGKALPGADKTMTTLDKVLPVADKNTAADKFTTTMEKTPAVANKVSAEPDKISEVVGETPAVTKPKKPFRLEDDDEFDLKIEEKDFHPQIKTVAEALWFKEADLGEISERTINIPTGQTHPRRVNMKLPPHPEIKPLRESAWLKKAELGEIIVKTVKVSTVQKQPRLNLKHLTKESTPKVVIVPERKAPRVSKALEQVAAETPKTKQMGWAPELLHKAVEEAAKGLLPEKRPKGEEPSTNPNIEDLILAKQNLRSEPAALTMPRESESLQAPKVQVPSQLVKSSHVNQELNNKYNVEILTPDTEETTNETFKSQIDRKELKRLIQMEFERISKQGIYKRTALKPGVNPAIEMYPSHNDTIPELPDVDSLIREPWPQSRPGSKKRLNRDQMETKIAVQTPEPKLNIKLLGDDLDEMQDILKTTDKPPTRLRRQNITIITEPKKVITPQQVIDKIPVQGKEGSGIINKIPVQGKIESQIIDKIPVQGKVEPGITEKIHVQSKEESGIINKIPVQGKIESQITDKIPVQGKVESRITEKIPVQGKEESGMIDSYQKASKHITTPNSENAKIKTIRPGDVLVGEPRKTIQRQTGQTIKIHVPGEVTPGDLTSKTVKKTQIQANHGQYSQKSLQNEIKSYVKDLNKTGYFQQDALRRSDKQYTPSHLTSRNAPKQPVQMPTTNENTHRRQVSHMQSSFKQSDTTKPRYNQIKYPLRLRTHSGENMERVKTTMQSDARPSTSSGETAPGGGTKGPEQVPPPAAGGNSNSNKPPTDPPNESSYSQCVKSGKSARSEQNAKQEAHTDTEAKAEDWSRNSEAPLTGLSKHFNSSTIRGRANGINNNHEGEPYKHGPANNTARPPGANSPVHTIMVAKATFALIGLYTVYRMLRKEPREY